jgi:flagellin
VNAITQRTGVQASLINGDPNSGMVLESIGYGSDSFLSVERVGGPPPSADPLTFYRFTSGTAYPDTSAGFDWATLYGGALVTANRDSGQDVQALINGTLANGEGLQVSINSPDLAMELLLDENFATDPSATPSEFEITGGGSLFQLGPDIVAQQQQNVGIQSVAASLLGGTLVNGSLQFLSSLKTGQGNSVEDSVRGKDFTTASKILDKAIDEVSVLRGRLGAFERNVLETNDRSLSAAYENLSASRSTIRDADFAAETSNLTRAQILNASSTQVLGLANQQSQSVLQLLG